MARAFVGVGSNIDAEQNVREALRALRGAVRILGVSTFYRTPPLGHPDDPWFINGVVAVEADRPADAFESEVLRRIEAELGRCRGADRNAPRTIDLDLLLVDPPDGTEPDPHIADRAFVAWPLAELAPDLALPDGRPLRSIAEALPRDELVPLPELTAALRGT